MNAALVRRWEIHAKLLVFPLAFLLGGVALDLYYAGGGSARHADHEQAIGEPRQQSDPERSHGAADAHAHSEHRTASRAESSARKSPAQQPRHQQEHEQQAARGPQQPQPASDKHEHDAAQKPSDGPNAPQEPKPAPSPPTKGQQEHGHEAAPQQSQQRQKDEHEHAAGPPKPLVIPPEGLAPGQPGADYTPVITPNAETLPWRVVDGAKIFHLVAEEVEHEFAPGLKARCWGYNGRVHGPTIEAVEGDRVRIYVTNRLPVATSVHWHGILLPNGMDGVAGLTQPKIEPGETFRYEYVLRQHGTHMYHPHHDEMVQMGMGMMGLFVIHPRTPPERRVDRDFAIQLSEWRIDADTARPNPFEMSDFNVLTFNGRAAPGTAPLVAATGERVRIRIGNLSAMSHHPIHLHGFQFRIVETDGGQIPESAQQLETTVLVQVGSTRTIEFVADAPGDWALHCHMTHHVMNQMGHEFPNMIGVHPQGLDASIKRLLPAYMTMGQHGMADMHPMPMPANSIAMRGVPGPFGEISMGGMFTVLKVRDRIDGQQDPGWYAHPDGTVASSARAEDLERDGIKVDSSRAPAPRGNGHRHH